MKKLAYAPPLVALSLIVFVTQVRAVALPGGEALFETSLQSRISSTDTSMTLVANSVGGSAISGYHCFTIDEGRSDAEFVCGNVSGTTVTNLERGLSYVNGTSTASSLAWQHRTGADVKITDFPLVQRLRNQANGTETYPNKLYYDSSPTYTGADNAAFASKGYVDSVALSGAPNGNTSTKGVFQEATGAQAAAGTATGSTGADLILSTRIATSTPYNSGANVMPVTNTNEKLSQLFLDLTQFFNFSGGIETNASSTLNATTTISNTSLTNNALQIHGLPYLFPSVRGASSTILSENGSGGLTWEKSSQLFVATTSASVNITSTGGGSTSETVYCAGNGVVVGGGYNSTNVMSQLVNTFSLDSVYTDYASAPNAWTVGFVCSVASGGTCSASASFVVYAICTNP